MKFPLKFQRNLRSRVTSSFPSMEDSNYKHFERCRIGNQVKIDGKFGQLSMVSVQIPNRGTSVSKNTRGTCNFGGEYPIEQQSAARIRSNWNLWLFNSRKSTSYDIHYTYHSLNKLHRISILNLYSHCWSVCVVKVLPARRGKLLFFKWFPRPQEEITDKLWNKLVILLT